MSEEKICFVIAPIGEPESDTRKRSDQILEYVITPAVNECGYDPIRADKISEPGIITTQVIQHIVEDPLVIADLTGQNPNVFYELAIRHALRKPLVQIIRKGEPIPFDVAATRTIPIDHCDLDSVREAKTQIVRQIKAIEEDPSKIDTPISVTLDLQALRQSGNPEQRSLADIMKAVSELRSVVLTFEKRLGDPNLPYPSLLTPWRLDKFFQLYSMYEEAGDLLDQIIMTLSEAESRESVYIDIETYKPMLDRLRARIRKYMNIVIQGTDLE
jgi:hypothetical protein